MSPAQVQGRRRQPSVSHRRSQSIPTIQGTDSFIETLGHPATFRESFSIAADEMRKARSPSPPPRGHAHAFSTPVVSITEGLEGERVQSPRSDYTLAPRLRGPQDELSETAPLIHHGEGEEDDDHGHSHPGKSIQSAHGHGHGHGSMNMKAILLHVLGDALGNVGVIATGLIIWQTTWSYKYYFDPVISLVITAIIFSSAMPLGKFRSLSQMIISIH